MFSVQIAHNIKTTQYRDMVQVVSAPVTITGDAAYNPGTFMYDMSGNVQEWCWDLSSPGIKDKLRRTQGGSWNHNAFSCQVTHMHSFGSRARFDTLGFRVACSGAPQGAGLIPSR
jgi:formylglycine-generating enzyme required for sulfatase activity